MKKYRHYPIILKIIVKTCLVSNGSRNYESNFSDSTSLALNFSLKVSGNDQEKQERVNSVNINVPLMSVNTRVAGLWLISGTKKSFISLSYGFLKLWIFMLLFPNTWNKNSSYNQIKINKYKA